LFTPLISSCGSRAPNVEVESKRYQKDAVHDTGEYIELHPENDVHAEEEAQNVAPEGIETVQPPPDADEESLPVSVQGIDDASCDFDFNLFRQSVAEDRDSNVVLSSFSIRMALAMAYNGADGLAEEAMARVLDFEGLSLQEVNGMMRDLLLSLRRQDESALVEIANSFWEQEGEDFYDELVQSCRDYYQAEIQSVDFKDPHTVKVINDWARTKTHDRIDVIIPNHDLIKDNLFAWMNAVYFKAQWTLQFDETHTCDEDFILPDARTVRIPTMHKSGNFSYQENEDFQAIGLPYGQGETSMYVFLPREDKGLADFTALLNQENWQRWMQGFDDREGTISLPRFRVEYSKDLKNTLIALGMEPAFTGNALPKVLRSTDPIGILLALHKIFVEVNEAGTEGAAVTYIGGGPTCPPVLPDTYFTMRVDRPFFFAIRDNSTGALLFMGSILDPS
jgi:serine protease inhibitor